MEGSIAMWVITVYSEEKSTTMYEFQSENEAREKFNSIPGNKIISHIVYYNDHVIA